MQGFRRNDTFANIFSRITLAIDGISNNQYTFIPYSGNTNGQILFAIFLKNDYYNDRLTTTAKLYIDGIEFTNRQITL